MKEIAMTASFMRFSVYQKIFASWTGPTPRTIPAMIAAMKQPVPVAESQLKSYRAASGVSLVTTGAARVTALWSKGIPDRRGGPVDGTLDGRQSPQEHEDGEDRKRHPGLGDLARSMLAAGRGIRSQLSCWHRGTLVLEPPDLLRPPEPQEGHRREQRNDAARDVDEVRIHVVGPEILRQAEGGSYHQDGGQHLERFGPAHHRAHQPEGHDDARDGQDAADHCA